MGLYNVEITFDGFTSKVSVNGMDMSKATAVSYRHIAGEVPTLTLTLPVDTMNFTGLAVLQEKGGHAESLAQPQN